MHKGKDSRQSKGNIDGGTIVDWSCGDADLMKLLVSFTEDRKKKGGAGRETVNILICNIKEAKLKGL